MKHLLLSWLAAATIATTAFAQGYVPPPSASPSDVATALSTAQTAAAQAANAQTQANAAISAIPPACAAVPAMDTTTGSVGSGQHCTPAIDNTRPANVQLATAAGGSAIITAADGSFSGSWPRSWASAPGYAHAEIYGTSTPYICMVVSATSSAVSGKCSQVVTTALPGTLLALGATVINPLSAAPAGLTVRVVGRQ